MWGKLRPCFLELGGLLEPHGEGMSFWFAMKKVTICVNVNHQHRKTGSLRQTHAPPTAKASGKKEHLVVGFQLSSFMRQTEPYPLRGSLSL